MVLSGLSSAHLNAQTRSSISAIPAGSDRVAQLAPVNFNDPFHLAKFGLDMPGAATRSFVLADPRESRDSSTAPLTASTSGADNFASFVRDVGLAFDARLSPGIFPAPLPPILEPPIKQADATYTWDGGGGDNNWGTANNWDPNGAPPTGSSGNTFIFAGTTRLTPGMNGNYSVGGILFDGTAGGFTISSSGGGTQTLTLYGGGITNNSTNAQAINVEAITLAASQTWNAASGNLSSSAPIASGGFTLTIDGANNTTLSGVMSGSGGLSKTGTGTLTLSGANSYTGGTVLSEGTLTLSGSGATLGSTSGSLTVDGGTLDLGGSNRTVGNITGAGGTILNNTTGTNITFTIGNGNGSGGNYQGVIANHTSGTGTVALTKTGTGTITVSGANTYTGTTSVNGGVLLLNNANALPGGTGTSGGTSNLAFNGGVLGLGAGDFTRSLGTGVSGVQWNGNGGFAAYGADRTVNLGGASASVTWASGDFIENGDTFILGASDADHTLTFQNPIALGGATRTIQVDDGSATVDAILSGVLSGNSSSALTKTGAGTLSLTAANTYGGATLVSAGVLNIQNNTALGSTSGDTTVSSGAALELQGGIAVGSGEALSLNGTGISGGGALRNVSGDNSWAGTITLADVTGVHRINSDSGTLTISGGITETGNNNNKDLTFGGTGNVTVTGNITATNGDMRLFKDGTGTLTLSGTNGYNGTTTVNGGTLLINGNSSGATGAVSVNNSGTVLGGTGTIGGKVTVGSGATILGGTGSTGQTLTISNTSSGFLTLQTGSIIELALGASGAHSTISHSGSGTISFSSSQMFTFIDLGAAAGSYDNIIVDTGLSSLNTSGWTISNSGWSGTFTLDGSGNIDLTLTAVPEASTWAGGAMAALIIGRSQWKRVRKLRRRIADRGMAAV